MKTGKTNNFPGPGKNKLGRKNVILPSKKN